MKPGTMETWSGHVKTPADAIVLFEACRMGLLPRVQRRLSEKERQQIKSGSVFVWDEREAGMKRWTDGKSWSASRVNGSFLTYREMEGKRGGGSSLPASSPSGNDHAHDESPEDPDLCDGPDGYRYKPDGLTKQSFSIATTAGQHLHLISYFARADLTSNSLIQPTNDPTLRHIHPEKGMYPESTVQDTQNMPAMTRSPMVGTPYAHSPYQGSALSSPHTRQPFSHTRSFPSPAAGYGWPPSPMNTPPMHYSPYADGYRSSSAKASPMYPQQQQYNPPVRTTPGPTAFDRAPPSMANNGLPPPPPGHAQHYAQPSMPSTSQGYFQQYSAPPSAPPPTSQAQYYAPPADSSAPPSHHYAAAPAQVAASSSLPYPPPQPSTATSSHHYLPPLPPAAPQGHHYPPTPFYPAYQHPTSAPVPYSPQSVSAPPHDQRSQPPYYQTGPSSYGVAPLPAPTHKTNTPEDRSRPAHRPGMIPSISALINRTPSPAANQQLRTERPLTPNSSEEKMGLGEDTRTIRQLNKVFYP